MDFIGMIRSFFGLFGDFGRWIARNWKLVVFLLLLLMLAGSITALVHFYRQNEFHKAESERRFDNVAELYKTAGKFTQELEYTRDEVERIPVLDSTIKAQAKLLGIKPKRIVEYHEIQGETKYVYRDRIDTLEIFGDVFRSMPIKGGCITGNVYWMLGEDSANVDLVNKTDLSVTAYQEQPKNWFWRGRWNKSKWPVVTEVRNNCDTAMKWTKNLNLVIRKK